jgi:sRNA-binding carbon storage regulator CsrA
MHKKAIATLMAVLMIAAVSTVSAFALAPGTYATNLNADVPNPPHVLNFLGSATVSGDTITIPVQAPASVSVYGQTVYGYITNIQKDSTDTAHTVSLSKYYDSSTQTYIVTGLEITGSDVSTSSPFTIHLSFDVVDLTGAVIHSGMGATLSIGN